METMKPLRRVVIGQKEFKAQCGLAALVVGAEPPEYSEDGLDCVIQPGFTSSVAVTYRLDDDCIDVRCGKHRRVIKHNIISAVRRCVEADMRDTAEGDRLCWECEAQIVKE